MSQGSHDPDDETLGEADQEELRDTLSGLAPTAQDPDEDEAYTPTLGIARIITCSYKHVHPHVRHKHVDYRMGEFHIARGVWVNFISKNGHGTTPSGGVRVRADGAVPRGAAGACLPLKLGRDLGRGGLFNLIRALTK